MSFTQHLRLGSILVSILIGLWFPIRLIGYRPPASAEMAVDLLVSIISIVNIYLFFKDSGLKARRFKSWFHMDVLLDMICVFPWSFIEFVLVGSVSDYLLFLNLICARHVFSVRRFLDEFDSLQPIYYRLIPLMFTMPILVHLIACGWIVLGSGSVGPDENKVFEYVKALYWTFTTLTTVGYGDITPKTEVQMLYAAGTQLLGVGVFGYVLSNVASLLSRMDAAREHHMDNLDRVETYMRTHKIPDILRTKIRSYYRYLWVNHKGYKDHTLLEDLPEKIQSELYFHLNRKIIQKVPFLKDASVELLEDLMKKLEPRIYVPGERIFKAGDPGLALYFIQNGSVDITNSDGESIAVLSDGAFFGEMALISDRPRSATAKAVGFCDAYLLHKDTFQDVMDRYPEFRKHIHEVVSSRKNT